MRKVGYAFSSGRDLDDALLAGRLARGTNSSSDQSPTPLSGLTIFAEVDSGQSGYSVTATQKIWDSSLNSGDGGWAAPTGTAWRWNTTAFNNNEDYTFKNLRSTTSLSAGDIVEVILYPDKSETTQYLARPGGGGGSLVWGVSPITGTYTYGATSDEPAGTLTALTAGVFYLSTPWNTRVTAPEKMYGWWNKFSDNYYIPVESFYVKPSANYSATAGVGITTFTCYYNKKATLSLGTNAAFPLGIKLISDGFDAANASSNSLAWFNGRIIACSYDSANNIIYMDHPQF